MRRQLPAISQRLSATLDKLQQPGEEREERVPLAAWWESLQRQYRGQGIEFSGGVSPAAEEVPRALFDSAIDNLLQNALAKRATQPRLRVRVALAGGALKVCDTGAAVPAEIVQSLLRAPVRSETGLGIGLYQVARQAAAAGYELALDSNRDGEVCFALRRVV